MGPAAILVHHNCALLFILLFLLFNGKRLARWLLCVYDLFITLYNSDMKERP